MNAGGKNGKLAGARVLLVDDVQAWIEIARQALDGLLCELHCAGNGEEALRRLRQAKVRGSAFDLLITDLTMPDMNGFRMLKQLRSTPMLRRLPVVVTTVESGPDDVRFCNELNVSAYLLKPYKRERLAGEAVKAVEAARAYRERG